MTTATAAPVLPGRYLFADLVHIDHLIDSLPYLSPNATTDEAHDWFARRNELTAAHREIVRSLLGILCAKCSGRGRLRQYGHRSAGLCYQCKGFGLTAKGRKEYA